MFVSLLLLCGMSAAAQSVCGPGVCDVRKLESEMRVNRELYGDNYTAYLDIQSPDGLSRVNNACKITGTLSKF